MPSFDFEDQLKEHEPEALVCGIDEVGTGALAGPVFAGAVIIDVHADPETVAQLDDSKKLTNAKRRKLSEWILTSGECVWGLGIVPASECRRGTMTGVRVLAMQKAMDQLRQAVHFMDYTPLIAAIVDGASLALHIPVQPAIYIDKADSLSYSVAAASIIAKVARDDDMIALDKQYPGYYWDANKGYGTRVHKAAIEALGKSPQHRAFGLQ